MFTPLVCARARRCRRSTAASSGRQHPRLTPAGTEQLRQVIYRPRCRRALLSGGSAMLLLTAMVWHHVLFIGAKGVTTLPADDGLRQSGAESGLRRRLRSRRRRISLSLGLFSTATPRRAG